MNVGLYAAATGVEAQNISLATIANNLANMQTTAFKKSSVEFQDLISQNLKPAGGDTGGGTYVPTGIEVGNGCQVSSTTKVFTKGDFKQTDNYMDFAIDGAGFFEIQLPDGTLAYTRDGSFQIGPDGRVVARSSGNIVLGSFQSIPVSSTLYVGPNGEATGTSPSGIQTFNIQTGIFPNPGGLQSIGGNLYIPTQASGAVQMGTPAQNGFGSIRQKYLEMSNVNVTEEMVNLIMAQRAHEASTKAIQSGDEMLQRINQLRRS